ncbi:MAG: hypothetical protein LQ340_000403 [Diploschistes diacapsis]|nr:MAG: hypothetical protein LQ340_000403 [Diploschistes diacapsis]
MADNYDFENFEPKPFGEDDVDIKVECYGICGSDLHILCSGWFETPYPMVVGHEIGHWAIHSNEAAPMLCGGKKVGIVGIGGSGHFGVLFAKLLGADEVAAISRTSAKKDDVMKMGPSGFIATDEDKD